MVTGSIEKTEGMYKVDVFAKGPARLDFPTLTIELIKHWTLNLMYSFWILL